MLVVELPEVSIMLQGPWASWRLLVLDELMYVLGFCHEALTVGAQVDGPIAGNGEDCPCNFQPRGGAGVAGQVGVELEPILLLC